MGIIQIVPDATTVARIQKEGGNIIRGTFRDEVLKKWLERKNPSASKLEDAINTFTLSCAGYCVATYVLGGCNVLIIVLYIHVSASAMLVYCRNAVNISIK